MYLDTSTNLASDSDLELVMVICSCICSSMASRRWEAGSARTGLKQKVSRASFLEVRFELERKISCFARAPVLGAGGCGFESRQMHAFPLNEKGGGKEHPGWATNHSPNSNVTTRRSTLADTTEVRIAKISAELARTAEALANASAPLVIAAPAAITAGIPANVPALLLDHAESAAVSAPAVATLASPLSDSVRAPIATK